MSDQDRFDWDDDMDFESLADEQVGDTGPEVSEGNFAEEEAMEPPTMDLETPAEEKQTPRASVSGSNLGLSAGGLGFLFGISTLVSGLGIGGAVLFVGGVDPTTFWNPEGLLQVDQWFNFQQYPLNILYFLVFGVVCLTLLGAVAVTRSVRAAGRRHSYQTRLLDKIAALRLDQEKPWQDPDFKSDPRVSAFVAETLGSWRLQMARERKNSGLEGELRRLHKALEAKVRDDLVGTYENPFAGNLADAIVQLYDENETSRSEVRSLKDKEGTQSEEIMGLVQDARSWHRTGGETVSTQAQALDKLAGRLADLVGAIRSLDEGGGNTAITAAVADITREVETWSRQDGTEKIGPLNDLVDRGSKLAFQIAMEVARLGTRGERLLPMTQALEELTNDFRQATSALAESNSGQIPADIKTRLDQVQERLGQGAGPAAGKVADQAHGLVGGVNETREALRAFRNQFDGQEQRLVNLGTQLGDFTGLGFNPEDTGTGNPENPPEGGLNISQHDPFGKGTENDHSGVSEVDPFSQTPSVPKLDLEPSLPAPEEKVYDLGEFGAVRLDTSAADADTEEKVHDLSEFGAVALT